MPWRRSGTSIQWVNGRRLLRFTAMMVNVGSGHFEVRGSRASTGDPMTIRQVIYETSSRSSPISRQMTTDAVAKYAGDGHNHWHVQEMMRYDMWGGRGTFRGAKVGFCFLDSDSSTRPARLQRRLLQRLDVQQRPERAEQPDGDQHRVGDEYEWYLAWQWVDITGLPAGTYTRPREGRPVRLLHRGGRGEPVRYAGRELHDRLERGDASSVATKAASTIGGLDVRRGHRVDAGDRHHHRLRARALLHP